jgi:hypothetical protein
MEQLRRPHTEGREVWDVIIGLHNYPAILVAHDLKLFPLLAEQPLALLEVCRNLGLNPRAAEAVLSVCASAGLVEKQGDHYLLTQVAQEYLLPDSPTSFCGYFDLMIANAASFSYDGMKKAVLTDTAQVYGGNEIFEVHQQDSEAARRFTRAMHSASMAPALAWPELVDLSGAQHFLDVAGGSGAHCLGAVSRWPHLRATVFDIPPVCEIANEIVARHGLQDHIGTLPGNMWVDPFPPADVHFYSLIYHDWSLERCRWLTEKSFQSLEPGGRIIIHEWLYNDKRTGPFATAAYNLIMLLWCPGGQQYSGRELSQLLSGAGFVDIEVRPTLAYWSIVTGRKPK